MENKPVIKRIGGYLYKIIPIADSAGKVIQHTIAPFMVELEPRDILQIIVGASVLAIPVGLIEETWILGNELPMKNVLLLSVVSILFLSAKLLRSRLFKNNITETVTTITGNIVVTTI